MSEQRVRYLNGPGNGIGWCDYTWNPVTGCLRGCRFGSNGTPCYAETMAKRFGGSFQPAFHPERLGAPERLVARGSEPPPGPPVNGGERLWRIFVGSMTDMMHEAVPAEWIEQVIQVCRDCPEHVFIWLTKDAVRYAEFRWPGNCWLGRTVTRQSDAVIPGGLSRLFDSNARHFFVSVEPMLGPVDLVSWILPMSSYGRPCRHVEWVIIGGMTGAGAVQPEEEWVDALERDCGRYGVPVFEKENLRCRRGEKRRTEFPEG